MIKKLFKWFKSLLSRFFKPKNTVSTYSVPYIPEAWKPDVFKMTKAYFDQRQKEPRNRKRKPSRRMRHIYKTL